MPYTPRDKDEFWNLHFISFLLHLVSSIFAFYLIPPTESLEGRDVYVEQSLYWNTTDGVQYMNITRASVISNFNPILCIAINEAVTTLSHIYAWVALSCCVRGAKKAVYRGRSRPEEYRRRWLEYSFTAGVLEIGILGGQGELSSVVLLSVLLGNVAMQLIGYYNDATPSYHRSWEPTIVAFIIQFAILQVFIFRAANNQNTGDKSLSSLNYGYLTIIYGIMYLWFGVHQVMYMYIDKYARRIDVDKIYIVLGFTSKLVLSWTYIAINRQAWNELGPAYDDKVPWENSKYAASTWDAVKYGISIGALVIIFVSYISEWAVGRPEKYPEEESSSYVPLNNRKEFGGMIRKRNVYLNF